MFSISKMPETFAARLGSFRPTAVLHQTMGKIESNEENQKKCFRARIRDGKKGTMILLETASSYMAVFHMCKHHLFTLVQCKLPSNGIFQSFRRMQPMPPPLLHVPDMALHFEHRSHALEGGVCLLLCSWAGDQASQPRHSSSMDAERSSSLSKQATTKGSMMESKLAAGKQRI
jgi:hypothetical protein